MAPDGTWANITGTLADRIEVVADEIDVLGSAVMGLTMKCARCHSHKFDPIPHRDYYRLIAVFKGAYDEYDWLKSDIRPGLGPVSQDILSGRHLPYVTTSERHTWEENNKRVEQELSLLRSALDKKTDILTAKHLAQAVLPAIAPDGSIYVTDMTFGKDDGMILHFDPITKKTTVFTHNSRKSNGLAFDLEGNLSSLLQ